MLVEQRHPRLGSGTTYTVQKKNTCESEWKQQQTATGSLTHTHNLSASQLMG